MKYNMNRFAKLAGLPQTRGTLNESRYRQASARRGLLREGWGEESWESEMGPSYSDEEPYGDEDPYGDYDLGLEDDEDFLYESEEASDEDEDKDVDVVEIDDKELMKEVRNIKQKRINEERLKAVIEDELKDVLAEMQYGSSWMYGNKKPNSSKKGQVTRGFRGLGFK